MARRRHERKINWALIATLTAIFAIQGFLWFGHAFNAVVGK